LRPWQRTELLRIYDNPAGTRRAILSFGRKNGKTALAAFLLLLHLCGPEGFEHPNSQLFSAAQSRDQAALLFDLAAKIVRFSPALFDVVVIHQAVKELICPELGTVYRALSAEATTAFGLSPVFVVHDELGQVRGPRSRLYEALETATGAQASPLSIVISTQAPNDSDLLSILIDDGIAAHDPRVIVSLHCAPEELYPFGEEAIRLANPAFGDFLNSEETLAMARDAERMPSREAEFRNLILNQRVEASAPFVSRSVWMQCAEQPRPLQGAVYGGLDLSSTADLTALVLICRYQNVWQVHPYFWLPDEGLETKSRNDRVPYDVWRDQGLLLTAPGRSVDYSYVAEFLRGLFDEYDIRQIAFDRWGFQHLKPWLKHAGFTDAMIERHFVEFGQGMQSMSPALRTLEGDLLNQRIAHGDHKVLSMCAANAVVQPDPAGNRKLAKNRGTGRMDGMQALAMARGIAEAATTRTFDIRALIG
jgi:phage terminase large subunit-like protein